MHTGSCETFFLKLLPRGIFVKNHFAKKPHSGFICSHFFVSSLVEKYWHKPLHRCTGARPAKRSLISIISSFTFSSGIKWPASPKRTTFARGNVQTHRTPHQHNAFSRQVFEKRAAGRDIPEYPALQELAF